MGMLVKFEKPYRKFRFKLCVLTSNQRVLPDFLIIGAAKCGTTSLYDYLVQHPNVLQTFNGIKEVQFFDRNFKKGLSWYKGHFPTKKEKRQAEIKSDGNILVGEATPAYLFYPHCPGLIQETLPNVKLIVLLRNPIERAYSNYQHNVRQGWEKRSFFKAIEVELQTKKDDLDNFLSDLEQKSNPNHNIGYLARGIYVDQLERWFQHFSPTQFLILKSEDLFSDPESIYWRVLEFLELPNCQRVEFKKLNAGNYPDIGSKLQVRLADYYQNHNKKLYDLLKINFSWGG